MSAGHNMPGRHGLDWGRVQRSPASPVGSPVGRPTPLPQPQPQQAPTALVKAADVLPVSVLDAFFQTLPDPSLQQFSQVVEGRWPRLTETPATFVQLTQFTVPSQFVYIYTDVFYYGQAPSHCLEASPRQLDLSALAGLVRFELLIGNRTPMRQDAKLYDPYSSINSPSVDRTGWPFLEAPFGSQRGGGFAVYATSQQSVTVTAWIDTWPRFTITKLGAHLHGFAVPESAFEQIFRRSMRHAGLGTHR